MFKDTCRVMSLPPPVASENKGGLNRMDEPCTTGRGLMFSMGMGRRVKLMAPVPLEARLLGAKLVRSSADDDGWMDGWIVGWIVR